MSDFGGAQGFISRGAHECDSQKQPLREVVPGLRDLLDNPAEVLARKPVVIASAPYWVMRIMVGILVAFPSSMLFSVGFVALKEQVPGIEGILKYVIGVIWLGGYLFFLFVFPVLAVRHFMPVRTITLSPAGVVFAERRKMCFCPWRLFAVAGTAYTTGEDRTLVPINREAAGEVVGRQSTIDFFWLSAKEYKYEAAQRRSGVLGMFRSAGEDAYGPHAVLSNVFLARGEEIAALLQQVAAKMPATGPS